MRESLQALCERFIENRETVKQAFRMESSYIYPVCANIFCARGVPADIDRLEAAKALIKEKTGIFSSFRGTVKPPVACMLSLRDDPSAMMEETLFCYDALKQRFWGSEYLALVAFLLADMTEPGEAAEKVERGRAIYERMKKEHPFLTSSEDSVFAVLMAFSPRTDDELVDDMEACYQTLRSRFPSGNALQSVSHVLALSEGEPQRKTDRLTALYDAVIEAGGKYGRHNELATLAAVSILTDDVKAVAADMMEIDAFLEQQKGYGMLGLDRRTRMMHAAMLASDEYMAGSVVQAATLRDAVAMAAAQQSTIALIAAQQAAMCAIIAASVSTSAASHSN